MKQKDITYFYTHLKDNIFTDIREDNDIKYHIMSLDDNGFLYIKWLNYHNQICSTDKYDLKFTIYQINNGFWVLDKNILREKKLNRILDEN